MAARDHYEVLGVARDADAKAIRRAFRTLALRYHPDRNKAPDAQEKFKEVAEAYDVLADPEKRAAYDARGAFDVSGVSTEDLIGSVNLGDPFAGFGAGGLFEGFFGRRYAGPQRGEDIVLSLGISLERVLAGGDETVEIVRPGTCAACGGSGAKAGTSPKPCPACAGTGQRVVSTQQGNISVRQISTCPTCQGDRTIIEEPCETCGGRGVAQRKEQIAVRIPIGIEDGMVLRVPEHGLPSTTPGGAPGDLLVTVHALPDERFVRHGADLHRVEWISVPDAVLGATLEVPALEGVVAARVPRGTQPGALLRLKHEGLPRFDAPGRGDLLVELRVHVPEKASGEQAQLYERLRSLEKAPGAKGTPRRAPPPHS